MAPERVIGQAMGWGLSMALGNLTAVESWEWLASLGLPRSPSGTGAVVLGAGALALLLREPTRRLMRVERAVDLLTALAAGPLDTIRGDRTPSASIRAVGSRLPGYGSRSRPTKSDASGQVVAKSPDPTTAGNCYSTTAGTSSRSV